MAETRYQPQTRAETRAEIDQRVQEALTLTLNGTARQQPLSAVEEEQRTRLSQLPLRVGGLGLISLRQQQYTENPHQVLHQ